MADLNSTIVRGKLRVTEDINTNGNITGNGSGLTNLNASNISSGTLNVNRLADSGVTAGAYGDTNPQTPDYNATFKVPSISVNAKGIITAIGEHTVTIPASDNTDTKNTAGATNSEEKLYLIGAKEQTANPQTFSNSSIYMGASGILTASALSTSTIELPNSCLGLKFIDGDNMYSAAEFNYSSIGGAYLNMNGHLLVNEAGGHANKPDNKTGLTSVSYADYFDTGITVCGTASGSGQWYKLSFPGKSGTFLLDSDLISETYAYPVLDPSSTNTVSSARDLSFLTINKTTLTGTGTINADDRLAVKGFTGSCGNSTTPVYFDGGILMEGSQYAGGTRLCVNGTSYTQSATIYAPTATGTSGYHMFWNGTSISSTANTYKTYTTASSTKYYLAGWNSGNSTTSGNTSLNQMGQSIYMMGGSTGNLYASAFYAASDRRLKENIKDLDLNCLDLVNNINLREFSWKTDETHKPVIGAIAQEFRQVLPEKYVHEFIGGQETDDEYLSINDSKLVYLLIGAIQEQQKEIESLKAKIDGKII